MATKTYCDICGVGIRDSSPVYTLGVSTVRPPGVNFPEPRSPVVTRQAVCHACACEAVRPPALPSPALEVQRILRVPFSNTVTRDRGGEAKQYEALVDELVSHVLSNLDKLKAVP